MLASGTSAADGSFSITVPVELNNSSTLAVHAVDALGNISSCSKFLTYTHDDQDPTPPTITGTNPISPANSTTPNVLGIAEPNSTVEIHTGSGCSGPLLGIGTADSGAAFSNPISVQPNTSTPLFARAIDGAGNDPDCSSGIFYTHE